MVVGEDESGAGAGDGGGGGAVGGGVGWVFDVVGVEDRGGVYERAWD